MSSWKALSDTEGDWEVGAERAALWGAPPFPELAAGWDSGQGSGNQEPAPEKRAHPPSWKSGQRRGLPARSSSSSEFRDSESGPYGSAKQRPHVPTPLGVGHRMPAARTASHPGPGSADEQEPAPFMSGLRGLITVTWCSQYQNCRFHLAIILIPYFKISTRLKAIMAWPVWLNG